MFNASTMCPLQSSMAVMIHPFVSSGYLHLLASLPIWLQMYLTAIYLNPYILLPSKLSIVLSIGRQFLLPMLYAYICRQRAPGVIINVNSMPPMNIVCNEPQHKEHLDAIDMGILHELLRNKDGMSPRVLLTSLHSVYPELNRVELNKRLQNLLTLRRVQSSTNEPGVSKWFLVKEKPF
jgi:hypothetical protein